MKNIVISCGPIPARLDSVKFISNRFKGGLAFATAKHFIEKDYRVTIVKWFMTELPNDNIFEKANVVNIKDVFEYYKWYEQNAIKYDAFVMAAAVANLTPSNPYEGKFPSHNYSVGEKFNIEFEIAPRAIDIIKVKNPRSCLIGYKLFDAKNDEELIDIARHTMSDSKANVIFANTPATAKSKKLAILPDNSVISMNFQEHLEFMERAIEQEYFSTKIVELTEDEKKAIIPYVELVKAFEPSFPGYGTIAFKVPIGGIVTTSRGHKGNPVYIRYIDFDNKQIFASNKATLNAPLLYNILLNNQDANYVIHRHEFLEDVKSIEYQFPGTIQEVKAIPTNEDVNIEFHGYIRPMKFKDVVWDNYHSEFPEKYFSYPSEMDEAIFTTEESLEVGGNDTVKAKYSLDPHVKSKTAINLTYEDLKTGKYQFDAIILKNSIAYLTVEEIEILKSSISPTGQIIANCFYEAPEIKRTDTEVSWKDEKVLHHYLINDDEITYHTFNALFAEFYVQVLGFNARRYGKNSVLLTYKK